MDVLVRVRLKSDTVHSKFSTAQAGFSLAWVNQHFISNLCKLLVISSPWIHSLLFSSPLSPLFLFLSPSSHSSFIFTWVVPSPLEIQSYKRHPPQIPKSKPVSHKKHTISLVFAVITLFAVLDHYILFLPGSRARWRHIGATLLSLFLKHCFGSPLLPCHEHQASRLERHRAMGHPMGWGADPLLPRALGHLHRPSEFLPLPTEKYSSSS